MFLIQCNKEDGLLVTSMIKEKYSNHNLIKTTYNQLIKFRISVFSVRNIYWVIIYYHLDERKYIASLIILCVGDT